MCIRDSSLAVKTFKHGLKKPPSVHSDMSDLPWHKSFMAHTLSYPLQVLSDKKTTDEAETILQSATLTIQRLFNEHRRPTVKKYL